MELKLIKLKETYEFNTENYFYKVDNEDGKFILKRKQTEDYKWGHGVAVEGVNDSNVFETQVLINKYKLFSSLNEAKDFALSFENTNTNVNIKKTSTKKTYEFNTNNYFYKIDNEDGKCLVKRKKDEGYSWGHGVAIEAMNENGEFEPQVIVQNFKLFASTEEAQKAALVQENSVENKQIKSL